MLLDLPKTSGDATFTTYLGNQYDAAACYVGSQSLQPIGFDGEYAVVSKEWADRISGKGAECKKILSDAAKVSIDASLAGNTFKGSEDANESPFMKPSCNPDDYSYWCSFCNDFGKTLLLCSTCRVGVCVRTRGESSGCLLWEANFDGPAFIFKCHHCAPTDPVTLALKLLNRRPAKHDTYFRYDPAVLIVSLTWHETNEAFGWHLRSHMRMHYTDHEDLIMHVDIPLGRPKEKCKAGGTKEKVDVKIKAAADLEAVVDDIRAVDGFLNKYETAKIVVVVQTTCDQVNGNFIWEGDDANTYKGGTLLQILTRFIPKTIWQYLDGSTDSPVHKHKTLILNLAVGASIAERNSRNALLKGHCADAVISFPRNATSVSMVATVLTEFVKQWASTSSGYDFLVAHNMEENWVETHAPVLSAERTGHVLYDKFCLGRPHGKILACHGGCDMPATWSLIDKDRLLRIACPQCKSWSTIRPPGMNKRTTLGRRGLVKVEYPPSRYQAVWEGPAPTQTSRVTLSPTPGLTRSKSAIGLYKTPDDCLAPESSRPRKRRSAQELEPSRRKR